MSVIPAESAPMAEGTTAVNAPAQVQTLKTTADITEEQFIAMDSDPQNLNYQTQFQAPVEAQYQQPQEAQYAAQYAAPAQQQYQPDPYAQYNQYGQNAVDPYQAQQYQQYQQPYEQQYQQSYQQPADQYGGAGQPSAFDTQETPADPMAFLNDDGSEGGNQNV